MTGSVVGSPVGHGNGGRYRGEERVMAEHD